MAPQDHSDRGSSGRVRHRVELLGQHGEGVGAVTSPEELQVQQTKLSNNPGQQATVRTQYSVCTQYSVLSTHWLVHTKQSYDLTDQGGSHIGYEVSASLYLSTYIYYLEIDECVRV